MCAWRPMAKCKLLNDWLTEWVNEWMNERTNERTNEWINDWMNERTNEPTTERRNDWTNERMHEWTNERMNGWMNEWTNERTNEQTTNERINKFYNYMPPVKPKGQDQVWILRRSIMFHLFSVKSGKDVRNYSTCRGVRTWRVLCLVITRRT